MNNEDLITMGLTEEQAAQVMKSLDGNYVTKARFDEVNEENKTLKKDIVDRDKQLETLKTSAGDNEALKQQIADLQQKNADQKKTHDAEMAQLRLDNAIVSALTAAGAKNNKAVMSLLDMAKVKLGEDGKLTGFDEQLSEIQKSDSYLFNEKSQEQQPLFKGFQPGASSDPSNTVLTGYESRLADARKNNNQLEVIKIKQEAAAEGVILM